MPDLERLIRFVNEAPSGTMLPVERLRELLASGTGPSATEEERSLTPAEAAEWLHCHVGGRKRSAAAVRKVMRTGFRGVVLKSYLYGRERRTTESDLRSFVAQIGAVPLLAAPEQIALPALAPLASARLQVDPHPDPADEVVAAQERFRRRAASSGPPTGQRRAATGV